MKYPIKTSFKTELWPILLVVASIISGIFFYSRFPEVVTTHWNFQGQPDGFSSRFVGAFGIPLMLVLMYGLFWLFPVVDPKKDRYAEFQKYFHIFRLSIMGVLFAVSIAAGISNMGGTVQIGTFVAAIIGTLMIVLGNYMGKIKNNWFMGIRTPWTLMSENVWNKTHRFGGWAFVIFGLIIIIAPHLPANVSLVLFVAGVLLVTLGTSVYSYWLYTKERKQ